jgi:hypothetical protein
MCSIHFVMQLLQNPPLCSSNLVIKKLKEKAVYVYISCCLSIGIFNIIVGGVSFVLTV